MMLIKVDILIKLFFYIIYLKICILVDNINF